MPSSNKSPEFIRTSNLTSKKNQVPPQRATERVQALIAATERSAQTALHAARGLAIPNESLLVMQVFLGVAAFAGLTPRSRAIARRLER